MLMKYLLRISEEANIGSLLVLLIVVSIFWGFKIRAKH